MNMIGYEVKKQMTDLREEIKEGPLIWKKCKDPQDHHDDSDDYFAAKRLQLAKNRFSENTIVFRSQGSTQNTANTVSVGTSEDNCQEGVSDFTFDERDDQEIDQLEAGQEEDKDQDQDQRVKTEVQEISATVEESEENDFTLDAPITRCSSV